MTLSKILIWHRIRELNSRNSKLNRDWSKSSEYVFIIMERREIIKDKGTLKWYCNICDI